MTATWKELATGEWDATRCTECGQVAEKGKSVFAEGHVYYICKTCLAREKEQINKKMNDARSIDFID